MLLVVGPVCMPSICIQYIKHFSVKSTPVVFGACHKTTLFYFIYIYIIGPLSVSVFIGYVLSMAIHARHMHGTLGLLLLLMHLLCLLLHCLGVHIQFNATHNWVFVAFFQCDTLLLI